MERLKILIGTIFIILIIGSITIKAYKSSDFYKERREKEFKTREKINFKDLFKRWEEDKNK